LRAATLESDAFTDSLSKVCDKAYIDKLLPILRYNQVKFAPTGASASKSPFLMKNTFNAEVYNTFVSTKKMKK
jgi:hypothetical protein